MHERRSNLIAEKKNNLKWLVYRSVFKDFSYRKENLCVIWVISDLRLFLLKSLEHFVVVFFFFKLFCLNWNNVPLAKEYIQVNILPFYTGVGHWFKSNCQTLVFRGGNLRKKVLHVLCIEYSWEKKNLVKMISSRSPYWERIVVLERWFKLRTMILTRLWTLGRM